MFVDRYVLSLELKRLEVMDGVMVVLLLMVLSSRF